MTYHILRYQYFDEFSAVVNRDPVADEFWCYLASSGPCIDWASVARYFLLINLLEKIFIDIWSFFK